MSKKNLAANITTPIPIQYNKARTLFYLHFCTYIRVHSRKQKQKQQHIKQNKSETNNMEYFFKKAKQNEMMKNRQTD